MVESALINTLLGCATGALAGLLPGTGLLVALVSVYPYLIQLDLISMLCFYIGLANVAQFTGSVTAIYFGVPGESNSVPCVTEGHALFKQGKGHTAIVGTSLSSVCAGTFTLTLLILFFPFYSHVFHIFYQTQYQALIFMLAIAIFVITSKQKMFTILLMTFAYVIGRIGYNEFTGDYFLTFNSTDLKTGIPLFPVIIGILVVPYLAKKMKFSSHKHTKMFNKHAVLKYFKNIQFSLLGTVIGFICGLVPAVSTVLATNVSHKIAKYFDTQQPSYRSLISAEASNNSAILVTLVPLILLGIPITGSEAMLVSIMDRNLYELNWQTVIENGYHIMIMLSVILSLTLGLIISWPLSKYLQDLMNHSKKYFKLVIVVILCASMFYIAHESSQYIYFLIVLIVSGIFGFLLLCRDVLPFIFVFLLQNKLESVFVISYNMLT